MSYSKENASLCLRTVDITGDGVATSQIGLDNTIGTISSSAQTIKWKNVNFRMVLGDMYDKYDKFNITINSYSIKESTDDLAAYECDFVYYISGLPFSNQTYNLRTGNLSNKSVLMTTHFENIQNAGAPMQFNILKNTVTIHKPTQLCDITISAVLNNNALTNQLFNHQTFVLDIVGCDGYERNKIYNNQDILNVQPINNRLELKR